MALSDLLKGEAGKGIAIGFATAVLAPFVMPILRQTARPLARTLIKTGIILYHKGRETLAEAEESFDDLMAEVRAELAEEQRLQEQPAQEMGISDDEKSTGGDK